MTTHWTAAVVMLWFCVGWPGLLFWIGLNIGRHGFRHALTSLLVWIGGNKWDTETTNNG